ncbi:unnamed protein product [Prorocentrum cordatum]|uniref:Uncharacterized protein n=1 Tax=Prorocentrum cordatum TaxID=2364126 RepID=A0ABN9PFM3_9DINO|nr:unnamed protein product [Polarella glacialis]
MATWSAGRSSLSGVARSAGSRPIGRAGCDADVESRRQQRCSNGRKASPVAMPGAVLGMAAVLLLPGPSAKQDWRSNPPITPGNSSNSWRQRVHQPSRAAVRVAPQGLQQTPVRRTDHLRTEAAQLEHATCKGSLLLPPRSCSRSSARKCKRRSRAGNLTSRSDNVGHRLNRCKGRLSKICDDIAACDKRLEQAQKEKQELKTKRAAADKECAELQSQLVAYLPLGGSPVVGSFGVPLELLDGTAGIKKMVESEAVKEFATLFRAHAQVPGLGVHNSGDGRIRCRRACSHG